MCGRSHRSTWVSSITLNLIFLVDAEDGAHHLAQAGCPEALLPPASCGARWGCRHTCNGWFYVSAHI